MIDHFEVLGVGRRPWLDPELLRKKFLELSARVHPDRVHEAPKAQQQEAHERYTALNAAFQALRDPKSRLLHLLTLERGKPPPEIMAIPHETTDRFVEVANLCREADRFLAQGKEQTSPLLKVRQFEQGQQWIDRLQVLQGKLQGWREALSDEVKELGDAWERPRPIEVLPGRSLPLERLETIYRLLSYATRWTDQLQERIVQLMQ